MGCQLRRTLESVAQQLTGKAPWIRPARKLPKYPEFEKTSFGRVTVDGKTYKSDIYIRPDGTVKKRNRAQARQKYGTSHEIGPDELKKVCKGGTDILVIGTGQSGQASMTAEGKEYLQRRGIMSQLLPTPEAIRQYNRAKGRKAALIHVTC